MSKLETAFSKALREKAATEDAKPTSREIETPDNGLMNASLAQSMVDKGITVPRKNSSEPGNSKAEIRKMSHDRYLSDDELAKRRIIYPRMKDKRLLNIYRNLRTKLLAKGGAKNFITLVTSVVPGGGSSLISANIAATFAFDEGKTALLIEGNIQNPSLCDLFGVNSKVPGLTDFIESESTQTVKLLHETGVPRLRFIPSGTGIENSAEYFTSKRMNNVIKEIVSRYPERYPVIDAPSVVESADTQILMELCDQVVLVIPYGACSEQEIKKAVETVGRKKLAGVVLNQF